MCADFFSSVAGNWRGMRGWPGGFDLPACQDMRYGGKYNGITYLY
jgi:hypothetical protein